MNSMVYDTSSLMISIHALLAESDNAHLYYHSRGLKFLSTLAARWVLLTLIFLSTLSLRRATDQTILKVYGYGISIHALLAESDVAKSYLLSVVVYFYPRSPCGERLCAFVSLFGVFLFLSTLSLRRATLKEQEARCKLMISIHALLAESDIFACWMAPNRP